MVVERVLGAAQGFPPGIRQHRALGRHLVCRRVVLHDFPEVWWSAPPIATETVDLVGRAVLGAGQIAARLRQDFGHRSQCIGRRIVLENFVEDDALADHSAETVDAMSGGVLDTRQPVSGPWQAGRCGRERIRHRVVLEDRGRRGSAAETVDSIGRRVGRAGNAEQPARQRLVSRDDRVGCRVVLDDLVLVVAAPEAEDVTIAGRGAGQPTRLPWQGCRRDRNHVTGQTLVDRAVAVVVVAVAVLDLSGITETTAPRGIVIAVAAAAGRVEVVVVVAIRAHRHTGRSGCELDNLVDRHHVAAAAAAEDGLGRRAVDAREPVPARWQGLRHDGELIGDRVVRVDLRDVGNRLDLTSKAVEPSHGRVLGTRQIGDP